MDHIYLDNNATTMMAPEVLEAMQPLFTEMYGNPSSMHSFGGAVAHHVNTAREQVSGILGASPSEIVFTSGGSEADNLAIRGTLEALGGRKRHIITSRVEHPAVQGTCHWLKKQGYRLTELSVDSKGHLDLDELRDALTPDTALVTVMWANNETGVIFPIEEMAQIVKARGAVFHVDAVQAVGKIPMDLSKVPIDLLSLSGHKLHGPKGIGALYARKGSKLVPLIMGGHQENNKRAGTENVPGIAGLGQACALSQKYLEEEFGYVRKMRDRLQEGLIAGCTDASLNGGDPRLPNTLNLSFEYVEGEAILLMIDQLGISASSGSACASGSLEPSHVMRAMGVPFTRAHGSIRFSLSRYNKPEEMEYVIEHVPPIIERLREMSPFVGDKAWQGTPIDHSH